MWKKVFEGKLSFSHVTKFTIETCVSLPDKNGNLFDNPNG
jgi:hypothetical protein